MIRALLLFGLLLPACPGATTVEPDPPPRPQPTPEPEPDPTGSTPCERAAERAGQLGCSVGGPGFVDMCERSDEDEPIPALRWDALCMQLARDCVAFERCRGGT